MNKGFVYKLSPNKKQNSRMFAIAGATRYVYNWALSTCLTYYEQNKKFLDVPGISRELTKLVHNTHWLQQYPKNSLKYSAQIAAQTVIKVFLANKKNKTNNEVKFKKKHKATPTIYLDSCMVEFIENAVKLEKISKSRKKNRTILNYVRLPKNHKIPIGLKSYYNPTVTYDGKKWNISVSVKVENNEQTVNSDGIGIDLGIKDLAICSDGHVFKNINKTKTVRQTKKKLKRYQKCFSRKYKANNGKQKSKDVKTVYSNNMSKQKQKIKETYKRLANIRNNYLHQTTTKIIKRKPSFVVLEDLNVSGMMKNKHLSDAIQEQKFYEFRRQISYKSQKQNIPVVFVSTFFPSSKTCSCCGFINKSLKLSDRLYNCPVCQVSIDRDYNAAINIYNEGFRLLSLQNKEHASPEFTPLECYIKN